MVIAHHHVFARPWPPVVDGGGTPRHRRVQRHLMPQSARGFKGDISHALLNAHHPLFRVAGHGAFRPDRQRAAGRQNINRGLFDLLGLARMTLHRLHADQLEPLADQWPLRHLGLGHVTGAAAHVEQTHHWHEHIKHGDMTGGGDERSGFRHLFQAPGLGLAAGAEHNGHPSQQSFGGLGILGVDFRLIGRAGAGRVILCRVHKRVAGGQTLDLLITQRAYGRTRRRFSFGCHGLYCGTDHRPTIPAQHSRECVAQYAAARLHTPCAQTGRRENVRITPPRWRQSPRARPWESCCCQRPRGRA